jgi:flagellar basal-body rod protein FlgB
MLQGVASGIERFMNLVSLRQKVVAGNIANADTPGFRTQDVDFRSAFEAQLQGLSPQSHEVSDLPTRSDGNNVSLDREARLLAENALQFNLASSVAGAELRAVKMAIQEGGKS